MKLKQTAVAFQKSKERGDFIVNKERMEPIESLGYGISPVSLKTLCIQVSPNIFSQPLCFTFMTYGDVNLELALNYLFCLFVCF